MIRKRKFELPLFNQLNKDQLKAIHVPREGAHLIIGGPGTGKSVVALWRVRELHSDTTDASYCFLVHNRLLHRSSKQLMAYRINSHTWISWFKKLFESVADRPVQMIQATIDWQDVTQWMDSQNTLPTPAVEYLIIDEGQDMPPIFYNTLVNLGIENYYVVADQNQQITRENSSRRELENALAIETATTLELRFNYRNTYPIARLAREFYTDDPASPPPDLPSLQGRSVSTPKLLEYSDAGALTIKKVIEGILKRSDSNPEKLIGILTPTNETRNKYFNLLKEIGSALELDHLPVVRTYDRVNSEECSFDEGGIFVLNAQACKGLEFDTVFIADIQNFPCHQSIVEQQKRLFYVMIARARESIFLLKKAGHCSIESILPQDTSILERWPERVDHER